MTEGHTGSGVKSVLQNAASVTISSLLCNFILGVVGIYIVRYLGLSLYSDYSAAMFYMAMFSILGRLGFNRVCLRECSRDASQTALYYGAALLLNVSLITLGYVAALIIAFCRYDSQIFILTVILGASLVLMSLSQIPLMVFQAHQKMHLPAAFSLFAALFYAVTFFVAIKLRASVYTLATLHLAMNMVGITLKFIFSFRISLPIISRGIVWQVVRVGRSFCVISIMIVLYSQSNGFLLALFNKGNEVGIYAAAFRLYGLLQMVAHSVDTAISPAIYGANKGTERITRGVRLALRYFVAGGILVGTLMIGRANWLMITLFQEEFLQSTIVLKLLGVAIAFRLTIFLLSHVIYGQGKERYMATVMTILASFAVGSGLLIIPQYGAIAAGTIFLAAEGIMAVLSMIKSEQVLGRPGLWKLLILPAIAGMMTLVMLTASQNFPIAGLLLSPVVFYGFLLICGYYRVSEAASLFKLLVDFRTAKNREDI